MIDFGRMENIMYACRMNLYWEDEEKPGYIADWREAEVVSIKDDEITLYNKEYKEYSSWNIWILESKLEYLADKHSEDLRRAFADLRKQGVIK